MRRQGLDSLRRIGALLWPHAREERGRLAGGTALGVLVVLLQLLQPWPLKWILDFLTGRDGGQPAVAWLKHSPAVGMFTFSLLYVVLSLAAAGAFYGQVILLNGAVNRAAFRFRASLFAHVLRQPLSFHESRSVGELLTRIVYDTSRLRRGISGLLIRMVQTILLFFLTFALLFHLDAPLGLVFGVAGVLAVLAMRRRGGKIARFAKKQRTKEGRLASLVADELVAVRELQTFGLDASAVLQRFARRNERSLRQEQRVRRLAAGLTLTVEVLLAGTIALALWIGAQAVHEGRLTPGDLLLFFSYALALRGPLTDFANQTARVGRTYACGERLHRIVARAPAIADRPGAVPAPALRGEIVFESVSLRVPKRLRGERKWALDDLSCAFPAGKRVALVGANGAGKSTLMRLVLRLAEAERGCVLLDGVDLRDYQIESVRAQISVAFQDSVLTRLTVRENIALGLSGASDEAIRAAAEAARVATWIERLPQGYDTQVRQGGDLFSGGERRRLALARAILRNGRIWLLDEPTSGLDHDTSAEVVDLLLDVTSGRTTLWVTHDPVLVARLDWVVALREGRVQYAGSVPGYTTWCAERGVEATGGSIQCKP